MQKFLKKIALFSLPFLLYLALVAWVDPFSYLSGSGILEQELREEIALETEPHMQKMLAYEHDPKRSIALGDSRTDALFQHFNTDLWSNLAYEGGSVREMIETFWWAEKIHRPDTVLIGLNLRQYNKYHKNFWVEETVKRNGNFFSYAFSSYTFRATMTNLHIRFAGGELDRHVPESKEQFWQHQLKVMAPKFFANYGYPDEYYKDLQHIARYCKKHKITLLFWVPPNHTDFQDVTAQFGLTEAKAKFLEDISSMGKVYNFDLPNERNGAEENFLDPVHFNLEYGRIIYREIFSDTDSIGK